MIYGKDFNGAKLKTRRCDAEQKREEVEDYKMKRSLMIKMKSRI
jgi:hypothetical protein